MKGQRSDIAEKAFRDFWALDADREQLERIETQKGIIDLAQCVFLIGYWKGWDDSRKNP